ncbi:MAG: HAMP domain-containing protein [Ardenticatenaceae bacterium]|nr:HAMP domain-containing protein [Anaerolineales bacterium]MCB8919753.1 HAMP domain-containing protein [Ardenticatenaceae bacterium]
MFGNIRWRIAVPYAVLILVAMGALAVYLSQVVRTAELANLQANMLRQAQLIADVVGPDWDGMASEASDAQVQAWSEALAVRVTLVAADGTVVGESHEDRTEMENHLSRPEIQQALADGEGSNIRYSQTLATEMLYVAVPVWQARTLVGYVRLAVPLDEVAARINQLRGTILTAAFLMALVAVALAVVIAERTARPVRRLTAVARRMADGDLDARLYVTSRDEVGTLTQAFNNMGEQLRQQVVGLQTERERLATILEHMADGVLITDASGRVQLLNPAASRMLNTSPAEALGASFAQVVRHYRIIEVWQQCRQTGEQQVAAIEVAPAGKEPAGLFLQMVVTPLFDSPPAVNAQSLLVIFQNLTPVRRLETVRRDFISNISHELRTPLASLKAVVETLRDGAVEDPPAAVRFLDLADRELDALTQMVEELLELSRIESGRVPLRLAPTAVAAVVAPVVERLRPQAERAELALTVNVPADLPLVLIDGPRVQQVLGNLLHNAIKFTPAGGTIAIDAREADGALLVRVTDDGVGIPAGDLPRIFERFYKADRARSGGGTGLGLAIARHIVQAHGGQIWARSKEGEGSRFYFTLPVVESEPLAD